VADETYKSNTGRSDNAKFIYDENTKKWVPTTAKAVATESAVSKVTAQQLLDEVGGADLGLDLDGKSGKNKKEKKAKTPKEKKAKKEYIEIEYTTLEGEANVLPTSKTIRLEQGKTVTLTGLGKYLSGQYYIEKVKRSINNGNGYSQSCLFVKTGFGDSLKGGGGRASDGGMVRPSPSGIQTPQQSIGINRPLADEVKKNKPSDIQVNKKVKFVDDNATYALAYDGVKVPEWVRNKDDLTVSKVSEDGAMVLLQPINSWTYTKYIREV